jgi:hypothetical protein
MPISKACKTPIDEAGARRHKRKQVQGLIGLRP